MAGKSKYAIERERKSATTTTTASHRRTVSDPPPPPYSPPADKSSTVVAATATGKKPPPPPPAPKPAALTRKEYATALYDFMAQADGDLTFQAGDRIEIVKKGVDSNEWWIGKLKGVQGQFPANYTRLE